MALKLGVWLACALLAMGDALLAVRWQEDERNSEATSARLASQACKEDALLAWNTAVASLSNKFDDWLFRFHLSKSYSNDFLYVGLFRRKDVTWTSPTSVKIDGFIQGSGQIGNLNWYAWRASLFKVDSGEWIATELGFTLRAQHRTI